MGFNGIKSFDAQFCNSQTGAELLDEEVNADAAIRQPFGQKRDSRDSHVPRLGQRAVWGSKWNGIVACAASRRSSNMEWAMLWLL